MIEIITRKIKIIMIEKEKRKIIMIEIKVNIKINKLDHHLFKIKIEKEIRKSITMIDTAIRKKEIMLSIKK